MKAEYDNHSNRHRLPRWLNIVALTGFLAVLITVAGGWLLTMEYKNKSVSKVHYSERMDPLITEPGFTPADTILSANDHPARVATGVYVDRIEEISMKDLSWTVDCYVWFNWKDSSMVPGDNFQVVDGWIESKEKKDEYIKGDEHYVL